MRRLVLVICLIAAGGSGMGLAAHPALAAGLCVGSGPGCYPTIQQALSVAHNGDVIRVGTGTFPGGITINVSVSIIGAGSGMTTIRGGGPVVTIGSADTTSEPTISISGLTITGGLNTSVPDPSQPRGGGIWIPAAADGRPGARVTVSNSVITGNSVRASEAGDCGSGCTFAFSRGGGIASFGTITLTNSVVSNNQAIFDLSPAPMFTAALGGGIKNNGTLSVRNSTVRGNIARFTTASVNQNGTTGAGGGIDTNGSLTVDGSAVSNNAVSVTSTSTDTNSGLFGIGGGIDVTNTGTATIRDSVIGENSVTATGYTGGQSGAGGGIGAGGPLFVIDSTVRNNSALSSVTTSQPGVLNGSQGGGIEVEDVATIEGATLSGNRAMATGPAGTVFVLGGALDNNEGLTVTMTDSRVTQNTALVTTSSGVAALQGGAINNNGSLTLRNTVVSNNTGTANGSSGVAQGGGVANDNNADLFGPPPIPLPHLSLIDSTITHNSLTGSPGIMVQGGGVYNGVDAGATVSATDSVIAQNIPDQCFDC